MGWYLSSACACWCCCWCRPAAGWKTARCWWLLASELLALRLRRGLCRLWLGLLLLGHPYTSLSDWASHIRGVGMRARNSVMIRDVSAFNKKPVRGWC